MNSQADEEWPTPGERSGSFVNPPGPFQPLRQAVLYFFVAVMGLAVLAFVAGAALEAQQYVGYSILAMMLAGGTAVVWAVLWISDTVLAFLKA